MFNQDRKVQNIINASREKITLDVSRFAEALFNEAKRNPNGLELTLRSNYTSSYIRVDKSLFKIRLSVIDGELAYTNDKGKSWFTPPFMIIFDQKVHSKIFNRARGNQHSYKVDETIEMPTFMISNNLLKKINKLSDFEVIKLIVSLGKLNLSNTSGNGLRDEHGADVNVRKLKVHGPLPKPMTDEEIVAETQRLYKVRYDKGREVEKLEKERKNLQIRIDKLNKRKSSN